MAGAIGCAPAPSPGLSAAARRTPATAGMPGKTLFSACHVFALFSTGVGQKTVDNSNATPKIYGTAHKARPSKDGGGSEIRHPSRARFLIGVVLLPPKVLLT